MYVCQSSLLFQAIPVLSCRMWLSKMFLISLKYLILVLLDMYILSRMEPVSILLRTPYAPSI